MICKGSELNPFEMDIREDDVVIVLSRHKLEELHKATYKYCVDGRILEVQSVGQINREIEDFLKDTAED